MKIKEQIAKVKKTIADKQTEISKIMGAAIEKGLTPDDDQEKSIDGFESEIKVLQKNLDRLESIDAAQTIATTEIHGQNEQEGNDSANPAPVTVKSNLEKGIGFALVVKASAYAAKQARSGNLVNPLDVLKSWSAPQEVQDYLIQKSKIGTTTDSSFGAPLVVANNLTSEFIELLRAATIFDKLKGMRQVPFNIKVPSQSAATSVAWVGEAAAKPVTDVGFSQVALTYSKLAGIVVLSDELLRFSNPAADRLVRDDLIASIAAFIDGQFLDPAKAETTESPASMTNGLTAITPTGVTAAAYDADLQTLINAFITANVSLDGCYFIMSETRAAQIGLLRDALGNKYFDGMQLGAGQKTLLGLPVITSETAGKKLVLLKPSEILLADDGGIDFAISNEASITYNNGTDDVTVNLFQDNLSAIRAERYIRWKKRRIQAAAYIQYA